MKAVFFASVASAATYTFQNKDGFDRFEEFKTAFGKKYESEGEEAKRAEIFDASLTRIAAKIANGNSNAGITKFSDLTQEEFRQGFLKFTPPTEVPQRSVHNAGTVGELVDTVDWRTKSAVTAVKDQGYCGSCWAFSATEQIESQWFLAGNKMTEFSPMPMVICDSGNDDYGCNGGDITTAFEYVEKAGGLETAEEWPYDYKNHTKKECKNLKIEGGTIKGYTWATPPCESGSCAKQDLDTLKANIASTAPAAICVNAEAWNDYSPKANGGVMTADVCGSASYNSIDHCVQLVGYTPDYWIVRNSWGTDWGIDGYIHLAMGNTCSVASWAAFVTV
jgi:C1A family cysteine protease